MLRFGAFELDLRTEELRKSGVRLHLPKQSFRILAYLAGCPGKVVTRDQLRHILWDENTHVDFDRCLNTAVNRLREVLNDSADAPRFIETLPRKGYRLLAHVEVSVHPAEATADKTAPEETPQPPSVPPPARPRPRPLLLPLAMAALTLVTVIWIAVGTPASIPKEAHALQLMPQQGSALTPALAPDGWRVAFALRPSGRDDHDIYVQRVGASKPSRISAGPADDFSPSFSFDGKQVAFYRRSGDGVALYLGTVDGGPVQRLSGLSIGPPGPPANPGAMGRIESISWSPGGSYLAYVDRASPSKPYSVFRISLRNRLQEQMTWPSGSESDGVPAFSPDGNWLAFVRNDGASESVLVLPLAGGEARRLTSGAALISGLSWARNGQSVVFSSNRAGESHLWTVPISGAAPQPLTQVPDLAIYPSLAVRADGLAFLRLRRRSEIRVLSLDDPSQQTRVDLSQVPAQIDNTRFSPDETRLAFSAEDSMHREIWISRADGSNPQRLTTLRSICGSPHWSPDGKWIAFDSLARGSWDVYVIASEGGSPRLLSTHTGDDVRPSWSADGNWIYYGSDQSGTMQIWKIPAGGGRASQVTRKGGFEAVESPHGGCVFYVRKGLAGLWRACGDGDERLVLENLQWEHSRNWAVTPSGVYFLASEGKTHLLKLLRFPALDVVDVASLGAARIAESGISIGWRGRRLAYARQDYAGADVAVLPNYR